MPEGRAPDRKSPLSSDIIRSGLIPVRDRHHNSHARGSWLKSRFVHPARARATVLVGNGVDCGSRFCVVEQTYVPKSGVVLLRGKFRREAGAEGSTPSGRLRFGATTGLLVNRRLDDRLPGIRCAPRASLPTQVVAGSDSTPAAGAFQATPAALGPCCRPGGASLWDVARLACGPLSKASAIVLASYLRERRHWNASGVSKRYIACFRMIQPVGPKRLIQVRVRLVRVRCRIDHASPRISPSIRQSDGREHQAMGEVGEGSSALFAETKERFEAGRKPDKVIYNERRSLKGIIDQIGFTRCTTDFQKSFNF